MFNIMEKPDKLKDVDDVFFAVYEELYESVKFIVDNGSIDLTNIDELIKAGMEAMDSVAYGKNVSGTRKMEVVKQVLVKVVDDLAKNNHLEKSLAEKITSAIETLGPAMFKLIVMADKGQFNFNHISRMVEKHGCCCLL